jgi:hypothetical protein
MSAHIRSFTRPLILISAAFLTSIGTATATDSAGDLQQQMREWVAGGSATRSASPSERHADTTARPTADVQELARRVLLGVTDSRHQGTEALAAPANAAAPGASTVRKGLLVREDAQAMARRLLLGQTNTPAAGS